MRAHPRPYTPQPTTCGARGRQVGVGGLGVGIPLAAASPRKARISASWPGTGPGWAGALKLARAPEHWSGPFLAPRTMRSRSVVPAEVRDVVAPSRTSLARTPPDTCATCSRVRGAAHRASRGVSKDLRIASSSSATDWAVRPRRGAHTGSWTLPQTWRRPSPSLPP
jgi:hypothetical protein